MFGHREDELRPAAMSPLRYAMAAGIAALIGGLLWPVTLSYLLVRMLSNKAGKRS